MRGNPIILATAARIEYAENLLALASDISESVMFIAERNRLHAADEQELIRILSVAARLRDMARSIREGGEA
jgi:hypothetical protein